MRELKINQSVTDRELMSVGKYLNDINRINLLSLEEEVRLAKKVKLGDPEAANRLVRANLRFVISVAKAYQHRGLSLGDLISEGNLGLIRAAEKFDVTKGFKFISFAVWWIRQSILMGLAEQSRTIRLPMNTIHSITKIRKTSLALEQKLERMPTEEEIAEELNWDLSQIRHFNISSYYSLSLDQAYLLESGDTLLDLLSNSDPAPDHGLKLLSDVQEVGNLLKVLPERQEAILQLYYGLSGMKRLQLDEIGHIFDLSTERVRQLKDEGLKNLRKKLFRHYSLKHANHQIFIV